MVKILYGFWGLVFAGALTLPVFAAEPHFRGEVGPIILPDGNSGTMRLLQGEGFLGPDPMRAVVLDAQGGVRALGPVVYAIAYSCKASACHAYLYLNTLLLPHVYEIDPSSMKSAGVIRADTQDHRNAIMATKEVYGFRIVNDFAERIVGALVCLVQWWPSFAVLFLIGLFAWPAWKCLGVHWTAPKISVGERWSF
jgi:hypothetical protein